MKNKKTLTIVSIILGILIFSFGISYSILLFNNSGSTSQLITGDIYMHYTGINEIEMVDVMPSSTYDAIKYFEFTINEKNTNTKNDIWYEILLDYGDNTTTRTTRIKDELLKFSLSEVNGETETFLFEGRNYNNLENCKIWVETIPKNTTTEIQKTYRLYM